MFKPVIIALAIMVASGCERSDRSDRARHEAASAVERSPQPAPTRSARIPQIARTAPSAVATSLPPEANPPGAPVLAGKLEIDRDVRYLDEKVGTGAQPTAGKSVTVHYTGWLPDGTRFDSSLDRGEPIVFKTDQVIKGWGIGLETMRVGGKRRLIIPAELGYGDRGAGDAIPPGAMLVFDVELIEVEP